MAAPSSPPPSAASPRWAWNSTPTWWRCPGATPPEAGVTGKAPICAGRHLPDRFQQGGRRDPVPARQPQPAPPADPAGDEARHAGWFRTPSTWASGSRTRPFPPPRNAPASATPSFWIVPAKVAGVWQMQKNELTLSQNFQKLSGTLNAAPIRRRQDAGAPRSPSRPGARPSRAASSATAWKARPRTVANGRRRAARTTATNPPKMAGEDRVQPPGISMKTFAAVILALSVASTAAICPDLRVAQRGGIAPGKHGRRAGRHALYRLPEGRPHLPRGARPGRGAALHRHASVRLRRWVFWPTGPATRFGPARWSA